jgi:phospholipase/lecithinase/hemolysin
MAAAAAAVLLASCGGGDSGPSTPPTYARLVSFGDSLSDVGTYRTAGLATTGGGQFTVNDYSASRPAAGTNWTEQLAYELALPTPCPARVGLNSSGSLAALAQAPVDQPACTNHAQGGSRVTNPVGPYNAALLAVGNTDGELGALTEPLTSQVAKYLAGHGGGFTATDLVTVLAGGNDAFMQLAALAAGSITSAQAGAEMQKASAELVALIRTQLLDKGAQRVVLVLLPDIGISPLGLSRPPEARTGLTQLSLAFNVPLVTAFSGDPRVLLVDAFGASELQALNPTLYGLANSKQPACDLTKVLSSLLCSAATVVAPDVSRYWFADSVHLTPYGYQLLARVVTDGMTRAGWLAPYGQRPCNTAGQVCALAPLP